jgi:hypothetical protein
MNTTIPVLFLPILLTVSLAAVAADKPPAAGGPKPGEPWRAIHVMTGSAESLDALEAQLPALAKLGANVLVCEVNYNFDFQSHPELKARGGAITKAGAGKFVAACRTLGIRVIPQLNCLGHQSWQAGTAVLLKQHPEFDETPGQFPGNKGIYCRSWCPQHPEVNKVVFALMDELLDAFGADAFHVGMDEVFLIGSEHCPRCKGQDPAKLLAKAVGDYHDHLAGRGVGMLMWGDRLIDAKTTGLGEWEAAANGTAPAADLIPKDIIICPWHYNKREEYLSIPMLLAKGFRVLPAGWNKPDAVEALIGYALAQKSPRLLGYMATTWSVDVRKIAPYPPMIKGMEKMAAAR